MVACRVGESTVFQSWSQKSIPTYRPTDPVHCLLVTQYWQSTELTWEMLNIQKPSRFFHIRWTVCKWFLRSCPLNGYREIYLLNQLMFIDSRSSLSSVVKPVDSLPEYPALCYIRMIHIWHEEEHPGKQTLIFTRRDLAYYFFTYIWDLFLLYWFPFKCIWPPNWPMWFISI